MSKGHAPGTGARTRTLSAFQRRNFGSVSVPSGTVVNLVAARNDRPITRRACPLALGARRCGCWALVTRPRWNQNENPATWMCVTDSAGDGVLGASMVVRGTDSEAGKAFKRPPPLARAQTWESSMCRVSSMTYKPQTVHRMKSADSAQEIVGFVHASRRSPATLKVRGSIRRSQTEAPYHRILLPPFIDERSFIELKACQIGVPLGLDI